MDTVELLVSEIVTNAVRASGGLDQQSSWSEADATPTVRLWLAADHDRVLVQVWDGSHWRPQRRQRGLEAEGGRGLLLVEALSETWGSFVRNGWEGKVVRASVRRGQPETGARTDQDGAGS
jgi:anti-sigma regulatory factor (Ser/Thr protein kinase)